MREATEAPRETMRNSRPILKFSAETRCQGTLRWLEDKLLRLRRELEIARWFIETSGHRIPRQAIQDKLGTPMINYPDKLKDHETSIWWINPTHCQTFQAKYRDSGTKKIPKQAEML